MMNTYRSKKGRTARPGNSVRKRHTPRFWIMSAVFVSSFTMLSSLYVYFRPVIHEKTAGVMQMISTAMEERAASKEALSKQENPLPPDAGFTDLSSESIPYLPTSEEVGHVNDLNLEPQPEEDAVSYTAMLTTSMGPMIYYNQGDSRWSDYLYGGQDPMKHYGCGPTAIAMIINSFTSHSMTPREAADWSYASHCYAPQEGSYHNLIPDSLSAHGLQVESVSDRTPETAAALLKSGHVLIALMGKGALTDNGHFILITEYLDNDHVHIADPNSFENSTKEWNLQQLLSELKHNYDSGAPLWAVSFPQP